MSDEWSRMWHPQIPATRDAPISRRRAQFEAVWKAKGWRLWKPPRKTKAVIAKETEQ